MENIDWDKYSDDAINFVKQESDKLLESSFVSFRESGSKCFTLMAIYIAILSFSFGGFIAHFSFIYLLMIIGTLISITLLFPGLFTQKMVFPGGDPRMMIHPYFEQTEIHNKQKREMTISSIQDMDASIDKNFSQVGKRNQGLKNSIISFLSTLILSAILSIIIWIC